MKIDLAAQLPELLPGAIAWVERQAEMAAQAGEPPPPKLEDLARKVGVREPSLIRIVVVREFPLPENEMLRAAAVQLGLFGPSTRGITYRYSVVLREGRHFEPALLADEFRHVAQYEACGSIALFLHTYLRHIVAFGYEDTPFEVDARAHEIHAA